jgi:hypothetical protein
VPKLRNRPKKYAKLANIVKRLSPQKLDLVQSSAIKFLESRSSDDLAALNASNDHLCRTVELPQLLNATENFTI